MKKYNILALTDHRNHSNQNSLYALLQGFLKNEQSLKVDVASRGNINNKAFFEGSDFSKLQAISVSSHFKFDETGMQFSENTVAINPLSYDIIMLRLPRPLSDEFLTALHQQFKNATIINHPLGIIECSNKAFLLNFKSLCPPMALCKSIKDVLDFSQQYDLVLKPLRAYGGKGLVKITGDICNDGDKDYRTKNYLKTIEEELTNQGYLAMKYLKNVSEGDKRLIVVNGDILASSIRLPPKDSWLCNVARGGVSIGAEPTKRELEIVATIQPVLQKHGILIYGVDTLVNDEGKRTLSEINTLSIGGFPQAETQTGKPIIQTTIRKIFEYADARN